MASKEPSTRTRASTRSTLRSAFNFTSKSKVAGDAILKDLANEPSPEKPSTASVKRSMDVPTRRSSMLPPPPKATAGRASIDVRPPSASRHEPLPEKGVTTRAARARKLASTPSEDSASARASETASIRGSDTASISASRGETRRMNLRPRTNTGSVVTSGNGSTGAPTSTGSSTALPKYRPKQDAPKKAPSPVSPPRMAVRRKASSSGTSASSSDSLEEISNRDVKAKRAVSPLPRRASATLIKPTSAVIPPTTSKGPAPRTNVERPAQKVPKRAATISIGAGLGNVPSASSSHSSLLLKGSKDSATPSRTFRGMFGLARSSSKHTPAASVAAARVPATTPKNSRTAKIESSPQSDRSATPTNGQFVLVDDPDNSIDDVEAMLSTIQTPSAATPGITRIMVSADPDDLETPSRRNVPGQSSRLFAPTNDSPNHLRPQPFGNMPPRDRGSFTLDQLAAQSLDKLGADGRSSMLLDASAPFSPLLMTASLGPPSSAVSREPSSMTPASPEMPAFRLPFGNGGITSIILPDSTPSPVPIQRRDTYQSALAAPPLPALALGTAERTSTKEAVILRQKVAQAEGAARDRLETIRSLEAQLDDAKISRKQDEAMRMKQVEDLTAHVAALETQMRAALDLRERTDTERTQRITALEDNLSHQREKRHKAVERAVIDTRTAAQAAQAVALQRQQRRWKAAATATDVAAQWTSVQVAADSELEQIRANKDALAILLLGLDRHVAF